MKYNNLYYNNKIYCKKEVSPGSAFEKCLIEIQKV